MHDVNVSRFFSAKMCVIKTASDRDNSRETIVDTDSFHSSINAIFKTFIQRHLVRGHET